MLDQEEWKPPFTQFPLALITDTKDRSREKQSIHFNFWLIVGDDNVDPNLEHLVVS